MSNKTSTPSRNEEIVRIIEALLFSSNEPLALQKIKAIIDTEYAIEKKELKEVIEELSLRYQQERRAFQIDEIAGGYLLRTCKEMSPFIALLQKTKKKKLLSTQAIEALAIIAHKSPITKAELEQIRGVDCQGALSALTEKELIEVVGRKETLGRPLQYAPTKKFLKHFGLKNLAQLLT